MTFIGQCCCLWTPLKLSLDDFDIIEGDWDIDEDGNLICTSATGRIVTKGKALTSVHFVRVVIGSAPDDTLIRIFPNEPNTDYVELKAGTDQYCTLFADDDYQILPDCTPLSGSKNDYESADWRDTRIAVFDKCDRWVMTAPDFNPPALAGNSIFVEEIAEAKIAIEVSDNTGTVTFLQIAGFNEKVGDTPCADKGWNICNKRWALFTLSGFPAGGWLDQFNGTFATDHCNKLSGGGSDWQSNITGTPIDLGGGNNLNVYLQLRLKESYPSGCDTKFDYEVRVFYADDFATIAGGPCGTTGSLTLSDDFRICDVEDLTLATAALTGLGESGELTNCWGACNPPASAGTHAVQVFQSRAVDPLFDDPPTLLDSASTVVIGDWTGPAGDIPAPTGWTCVGRFDTHGENPDGEITCTRDAVGSATPLTWTAVDDAAMRLPGGGCCVYIDQTSFTDGGSGTGCSFTLTVVLHGFFNSEDGLGPFGARHLPSSPGPRKRWRGLGDVVASVTKLFGVPPCIPCTERIDDWNKKFPLP